ncbi:MAG: hexose kinase [Roseitalea sp.]|jgi:6-phosphofructokinase 2|nr:hexose kinase [Roseitalea sp.]MBO6721740.1 hexose kinase [Roseitalea sp.]MBO6741652.1 hexose kinase [Roseitalea sp.]
MDQKPVVTVTLNPAVDIAADVETVRPDVKLRCGPAQFDPGGGGINVSRAIAKLGGRSTALVSSGGATGDMLAAMLAGEAIDTVTIPADGQTRQSFTARETATGRLYRFVLPGPDWKADTEAALLAMLEARCGPGAIVVVSGSLPPGAHPALIERMHETAVRAGASLIADTSGPVLQALCARTGTPLHTLRMDKDEALTASGRALDTPEDFAFYGATLVAAGIARHLVIGLGARGSVGVSADEQILTSRPVEKPLSAVGAGDSFVGAYTLATARGEDFATALVHGTAAAASAVVTPGTQLCDGGLAVAFRAEVSTTRL